MRPLRLPVTPSVLGVVRFAGPATSPALRPVAAAPRSRAACTDAPTEITREQAHVPAEQPPPGQDPRLPPAHAHPRRPRHPGRSPPQGPLRAVGLRPTRAARPAPAAPLDRLLRDAAWARRAGDGRCRPRRSWTLPAGPTRGRPPPRVGFVVPKAVGRRVVRNRARRRLRALCAAGWTGSRPAPAWSCGRSRRGARHHSAAAGRPTLDRALATGAAPPEPVAPAVSRRARCGRWRSPIWLCAATSSCSPRCSAVAAGSTPPARPTRSRRSTVGPLQGHLAGRAAAAALPPVEPGRRRPRSASTSRAPSGTGNRRTRTPPAGPPAHRPRRSGPPLDRTHLTTADSSTLLHTLLYPLEWVVAIDHGRLSHGARAASGCRPRPGGPGRCPSSGW